MWGMRDGLKNKKMERERGFCEGLGAGFQGEKERIDFEMVEEKWNCEDE